MREWIKFILVYEEKWDKVMSIQAELKMDSALSQFPFQMLCSASFWVLVCFSVTVFFEENIAIFLWTETIHKFVTKFKLV